MPKKFEAGFAIMRFEFFKKGESVVQLSVPTASPEDVHCALGHKIHPIRVLWSRADALAEAERLNAVNGAKGVAYCVTHTRV